MMSGEHRLVVVAPIDGESSCGISPHSDMELQALDFQGQDAPPTESNGFTLLPAASLSDSSRGSSGDDGDDVMDGGLGFRKEASGTAGVSIDPERQHLSSDVRTFLNLLISFIGAGILGIPYAFRQGGLLMSSVVITLVGVLCMYCMWMLVRCKYRVMAMRNKDLGLVTYADVCHEALGNTGLLAVESALVASQAGFSTAYLLFIARNLNALFETSKAPVILMCMPGLVIMCLIKHLKYLAPFSLIAEVVNLTGLAIVFFDDAEFMDISHESIDQARWKALPFVFGVGVYCFEGMGMVLPVEAAMINRDKFTSILALVMFIYTGLCVLSGALGYLAFGDETQDIILLNIGSSASTLVVKLSFCVGVYFTFPIMMVPVWEVLELKWLRSQSSSYARSRNMLRMGVVLSTGLLAYAVPNFGLFVSLIGSSCCALLAFILPTLCYGRLERSAGYPLRMWQSLLNGMILWCGVFAMVSGTFDTLHRIVLEFTKSSGDGGER